MLDNNTPHDRTSCLIIKSLPVCGIATYDINIHLLTNYLWPSLLPPSLPTPWHTDDRSLPSVHIALQGCVMQLFTRPPVVGSITTGGNITSGGNNVSHVPSTIGKKPKTLSSFYHRSDVRTRYLLLDTFAHTSFSPPSSSSSSSSAAAASSSASFR